MLGRQALARLPAELIEVLAVLPLERLLRDRGRAEGVGLDDVRARIKIGVADLTNDLRLRQRQEIVVALEIAGVIAEAIAMSMA